MGKLGAAVLALIAWPTAARAQPKPTPAQLQQAGELVKKAIAKSLAGDHARAIALYEQAYDLIPTPVLLSNIGTEYEQASEPAKALRYFCKYLDADPTGPNASYAISKAKALAAELGNLPAEDVCAPPKPKAEPPPPPPPAPAPAPAHADDTAGTAALQATGGPPAEHADEHPGRTLEIAGAAAGVVGVVGITLGVVYGLEAKSLSDQIDNHDIHQPWPSQIDGVPIAQWGSQGAAWNRDTYIFAIGGGVALAAGVALVVYGHGRASAKDASVAIVPTAGGLAAFGRF